MFQLRRVQYRGFSSSDVQLVLMVYPCFRLSTLGHIYDHTSGQIVSGLHVTCVLFSLPYTHE